MDNIKTNVVTREDLTRLIDELNLKIGAEIGVNEGVFSDYILGHSKLDKLYSIDAWSADEKITKSAFKERAAKVLEECFDKTKRVLEKYGDRSRIMKKTSFDAVSGFKDSSLDFLYLDASHRFTGFSLDVINWFPKVRLGGIFSGHDYWSCYRCEVMDVVNAFFVENKQILHITTKGVNSSGRPFYPPTWWCIKQNLTKKEYNSQLKESIKTLLEQQKILLNESGVSITLPYQYFQ